MKLLTLCLIWNLEIAPLVTYALLNAYMDLIDNYSLTWTIEWQILNYLVLFGLISFLMSMGFVFAIDCSEKRKVNEKWKLKEKR